jgi:hypothetical protein
MFRSPLILEGSSFGSSSFGSTSTRRQPFSPMPSLPQRDAVAPKIGLGTQQILFGVRFRF